MKILVTCFSLTGNTRKIAEAIRSELTGPNDVHLTSIDKVDPNRLNAFELVFFGAPIHAGGIAAPAKKLLESFPENPDFKFAAFVTHASSAYNRQGFDSGVRQIETLCEKKRIVYLGCFDCQGRLTPELHDMVQKAQTIPDNEWAEKMAECDKHPDAGDEEKARAFARTILSQADS